jgi:hypothetical protein
MRTLGIALLSAFILIALIASPAPAQADREAASWTSIIDSDNVEDFRGFLKAFPKGEFANEARRKYSLLAHDKLPPRLEPGAMLSAHAAS